MFLTQYLPHITFMQKSDDISLPWWVASSPFSPPSHGGHPSSGVVFGSSNDIWSIRKKYRGTTGKQLLQE